MSHLLLTSRLIRIAFWFWEWFAITKNYRAIDMILSRYLNITRTQTINISWILMGGKSSLISYSQMMYIICIWKTFKLVRTTCPKSIIRNDKKIQREHNGLKLHVSYDNNINSIENVICGQGNVKSIM